MSLIEKQAALGRDLFELNTGALRRLAELQAEGVRKYFDTNRAFAEKLPEAKDIQSFMALQRDYGQAVWAGFAEGLKSNGEVLREAVEGAGKLLRNAFTGEEAPAPSASKETGKSASAAAAA